MSENTPKPLPKPKTKEELFAALQSTPDMPWRERALYAFCLHLVDGNFGDAVFDTLMARDNVNLRKVKYMTLFTDIMTSSVFKIMSMDMLSARVTQDGDKYKVKDLTGDNPTLEILIRNEERKKVEAKVKSNG